MTPKGPFKYIKDTEECDGSIFQAKFELANDGCPNSEQYLLITVTAYNDSAKQPTDITLDVLSQATGKTKRIAYAGSGELANIASMLYGAARLVTRQSIEPL